LQSGSLSREPWRLKVQKFPAFTRPAMAYCEMAGPKEARA